MSTTGTAARASGNARLSISPATKAMSFQACWLAIGLLTAVLATGISLTVEPAWFDTTEMGPGGTAFLASLGLVVVGAGIRAGANGNWNRGIDTAKWLLSGVAGGLVAVGASYRGGVEGLGAAVAMLAIVTFALGVLVFIVGAVAGRIWTTFQSGSFIQSWVRDSV